MGQVQPQILPEREEYTAETGASSIVRRVRGDEQEARRQEHGDSVRRPDDAMPDNQGEGGVGPQTRNMRDKRERPDEWQAGQAQAEQVKIAVNDLHYLIPTNWSLMAIFLASAYLFVMATNFVLPAPLTAMEALLSAGLAAFGNRFARREREEGVSVTSRLLMLGLVVILPMGLLGWVFASLSNTGLLDWRWSMAALIALNSVAVALLSRRLPSLFLSMIACWSAVALNDATLIAGGALVAGIVVLGFAARYQFELENARLEDEEQHDRLRRRAENILRDYEETGQGWFWETDRRGYLTYVSDSIATLAGKNKSRLIGRPLTDLFDLRHENREGERTLQFHLSARSAFQDLSVRAAIVEDERYWSINGRPIFDSFHNFSGFRGSGTDLTAKRQSEEQASRLAMFDSLTGLANRHHMSQSLEKILASPQQAQRESAVFLLDLDRFKQVNDTLGHPAGDALLKQVSLRLQRVVGELGLVGRLGGDEFEVIVPGRIENAILAQLATEIIGLLSQPYSVEGQRVIIGASVGIAVCPEHGETSEELIRNADLALYAAKDSGRGKHFFYANDLHSAAEERAQLEQDLRDAISLGGLELHYQPVVHTTTERISGFEALLRWKHPKLGWMSPAKFIPVAEDAGLIDAIGEWAIRTACNDLAGWPEEVRCAVNVSTLQFANPQLANTITSALAQSGITPSRLELEITESVFLQDDANVDRVFAALKGIGVRLALDDFGTGYSSLGYLKKAPFDKIKIDQSFVRGATIEGSRNGAIIASIVSLAQALGMDTTAEGVETFDELDLVRMHGCSHIQGYIYDKPLPPEDATRRLQSGLASVAQGPRSSRAPRHAMLRKVVLEHGGQYYYGTIRNISDSGAMITGLWNVPPGTIFSVALSETQILTATARWSQEDRMGVEFSRPLSQNDTRTDFILSEAG
ncbi:MAG: EAL domain-containing protein [Sphingomonadaceae bacterium]